VFWDASLPNSLTVQGSEESDPNSLFETETLFLFVALVLIASLLVGMALFRIIVFIAYYALYKKQFFAVPTINSPIVGGMIHDPDVNMTRIEM